MFLSSAFILSVTVPVVVGGSMRAVEGDVRDVGAAQSRLAIEGKGLRMHNRSVSRSKRVGVGRSVGHLDPTAMLFLPLACMVIVPAPL